MRHTAKSFRNVFVTVLAGAWGVVGIAPCAETARPEMPASVALTRMRATELCWRIPVLADPVTVDGRIDPREWRLAAKTSGLLNTRGLLVAEADTFVWVGTDGHALFVAVRSATGAEEPGQGLVAKATERDGPVWSDDAIEILVCAGDDGDVYQVIINSIGTVFDAVRRAGSRTDASHQMALRSASRVEGGWWDIEVAIPLAEIGSPTGSLKLNVCRDSSTFGPSSLTGAATFADPAGMLRLSWADGVPVVRVHGLGNTRAGHVEVELEIEGQDPAPLRVLGWIWRDASGADAKPLAEFAQTVSGNWRGSFPARLAVSDSTHRLTLGVVDAAGTCLHSRVIDFGTGGRRPDPRPVTVQALLADHTWIYARHYPGYQRLSVVLDPFGYQGESIREIRLVLHGPAGETRTGSAQKREDGSWKALVELASSAEGTWSADVACIGPSGKAVVQKQGAFAFEKKRWVWEGNRLGISAEVIPPFTPLSVDGTRVSSVLRVHTVNGLGLWQQVRSLGRDLLAGPMTVECRAGGAAREWQAEPPRFTEIEGHKVVAQAHATAGSLTWDVTTTYDYDGFMWAKVRLAASDRASVDRLVLRIPMKAAECTLMHACADRIRKNKAGFIADGTGEVWNSVDVERYRLSGDRIITTELIPYFWFGGEQRGICWAADNSLGFSLRQGQPAIRVLRPDGGVVVAEIDLINQPTAIAGERSLEFGLQATPVKPLAAGWRNWHFGCGNYIPGMTNISFGVHALGAGHVMGWWKYPLNHDYSYLEYLRRATRTKKEDLEFMRAWMDRTHSDYLRWTHNNVATLTKSYTKFLRDGETIPELWTRWRDIYMTQWSSRAARSDRLVPYGDQRLQIIDSPEVEYYAAEWWNPQLISYAAAIRTFLTPSNIDFTLHCYKKMLEHGFDGIYLDDTYILPGNSPDNDTAVLDHGRILPRMGLLATRELVKRLAVIQHELGMSPRLTIVHMSNALLIPAFAFADVSYDWEMGYGDQDFQDRFSLDFIRTESIGLQGGLVPTVLGGVVKQGDISWSDWLKGEKKRLTRTSLGMTLIHEIRINHQKHAIAGDLLFQAYRALHRFDIANPDCTFVPYWQNDRRVTATGGDLKTSFYTRPSRLLLIVANMGDDATAVFRLDRQALGIRPDAVLVDVESGTVLDAEGPEIPRHDFRMVYVGREEAGKALSAADPEPGE